MTRRKRPTFGVVDGYVEPSKASNRPPSQTALPDEAKVSTPGERAAFLTKRLQEATKSGEYATVPNLADELLANIDIASTSRNRLQAYIRDWLHKRRKRGDVEHVKGLIGLEHRGTDGWRWHPAKLEGPTD